MTEIISPRFKTVPALNPVERAGKCGDFGWATEGVPTPLAEPHEDGRTLGLRPGMFRFGDREGVERYVTLESVDKDWNTVGWQYLLTPEEALRLAADITDAAWKLLDDKRESGR
jgi:hypothetical protein